jgi:putative membrane protein
MLMQPVAPSATIPPLNPSLPMKVKIPSLALVVLNVLAVSLAAIHAAPTDSADQKFAKKAAAGGMFEVKLGEVAQKNGDLPEVKKFGAMMVADHGKAGEELAAIAAKEGIKLPAKLPKKLQSKTDKLSGLTGKAFDAAYVTEMVADHEKDLAEFQAAAKELTDPSLKEFAAKTSAVIQKHLEAIRKIQASMNKAVMPS